MKKKKNGQQTNPWKLNPKNESDYSLLGKKIRNYLNAIHEVIQAITTGKDSLMIYNILLDRIATQINVDSAALLLMLPTNTLVYSAGRGFRTSAIQKSKVSMGESLAGKAAQEKKIIYYNDTTKEKIQPAFIKLLFEENFINYIALPLVAKEDIKGVIELFHRSQFQPDADCMHFLKIMSQLAVIIIHNEELSVNQKLSNLELEVAYGATLEAWAHALELRDSETAGHTQRVMELCLRLSTKLGVPNEALVHISRGALLHDIGKLAIPDNILRKTGPLDESEWEVMREHPNYAFDLLKPIKYLHEAIDIPYSHHEKWNGSGYPRGLKEEEIPFPARIFTVVDVFDALVSERPYREAWKKDEALDYISSKSGEEFDPDIVVAFLEIVAEENITTTSFQGLDA